MKFIAVGKNKIVNISAIAQASFSDSKETGARVKLKFVSGVEDAYLSDDARTLWTALQKVATGPTE